MIYEVTSVQLPRERVCEIYKENIRYKIYNDLEKIQKDIGKGNIRLSRVIYYDEEFLWVKHLNKSLILLE